MSSVSDNTPRIYVACLAAYNNGYLHGDWIDADQDVDEIRDEIATMLARSPIEHAEEYAIHDYEGFEGVAISEYAGIDTVARMGAFIAEHGALGAGLLEQFSGDMEQAETALQDCYHGQFASLADYMEELTTESVTRAIAPSPKSCSAFAAPRKTLRTIRARTRPAAWSRTVSR